MGKANVYKSAGVLNVINTMTNLSAHTDSNLTFKEIKEELRKIEGKKPTDASLLIRLSLLKEEGLITSERQLNQQGQHTRERFYKINESKLESIFFSKLSEIIFQSVPNTDWKKMRKTSDADKEKIALVVGAIGTMITLDLWRDTSILAEKTQTKITDLEDFFEFAKTVFIIQQDPHPSLHEMRGEILIES